MDNKKIKYKKSTNSVSSKLRMFLYSEKPESKANSDYIDMLCDETDDISATEKLNSVIEAALIKEFSPKIKESPNFHLLVEAVAHRLKKNSLREKEN